MTDTPTPHPLADRAVQRLRKLATGNGMEPAAIVALETQEQVFVLEGLIQVSPSCEVRSISYAGGVRGKDRQMARDPDALQREVARHQKSFRESPGWIAAVAEEIKSHEGQGWGLEDARVTLPEKSAIYAVTLTCPSCQGRKMLTCMQCHGQGTVICTQCQGQGRELCYHCGGRGEDPHQPGQKCPTCNGTRYAPCRFCQTRGHLPCPTCHGQRGTPCGACAGSGLITQESTVECGAHAHFKLLASDLPSGLRRGIERIGINKLGKGHADIAVTRPAPAEGDDDPAKIPITILAYRAALPYAEMRMDFGSRKAVISVVGKRCAIMGVPAFLDDALAPAREKLRRAAAGQGALEAALDLRAPREILALAVSGRGTPEAVYKTYPFGLSDEVVADILADMRLALNRVTLTTRAIIAALSGAACAAAFYAVFFTGLHARLTLGWALPAQAAADAGLLGSALIASWATLNFAARIVLQRRFPKLNVALTQKIGKTGYTMLAGVVAAFIICLLLTPDKPSWLALFMR